MLRRLFDDHFGKCLVASVLLLSILFFWKYPELKRESEQQPVKLYRVTYTGCEVTVIDDGARCRVEFEMPNGDRWIASEAELVE